MILYFIEGVLDTRLKDLHEYAWAESTTATRKYQWRKYTEFCAKVGINPIPMDLHMLNLFLLHLAITGLSYTTINNQVSALVTFAKMHRQNVNIRDDFEINLTLRSLRRILGDWPNRKQELLPNDLIKIYAVVDWSDFIEESTWVGILFLYRSMLRKSHIFAGEFNINMLTRMDVVFKDWGLLIYVNRSKTIQYRQRLLEIPVHLGGDTLCLASCLSNYFLKYPMPTDAPVLSRVYNGKRQVVNYTTALRLLKKWGTLCNLQKDLGMHSLRRGAATLMSIAGMQLTDIKDRGDWHSTAVLQYLAYPLDRKIDIDRQIVQFINQIL